MKKITIKWEDVLFYGIAIVLFIVYGLHAGYLIGTCPTLGIEVTLMGQALDMSTNASVFDLHSYSQFFPYGSGREEAQVYCFVVALLNRFMNNIELSSSIYYSIIYLISALAVLSLFRKITRNRYLALVFSVLWFINPFFQAQTGITALKNGLLFLPLSILFDFRVYENIYRGKKIEIKDILVGIFARILVTGSSWYAAVIAAVGSCLFFLFYLAIKIKQNGIKSSIYFYFGYCLSPWVVAMGIIFLTMESGGNYDKPTLEIFRGNGADLVTIFLPSQKQLISNIYSIQSQISAAGKQLIGDGTAWENYLGYTLIFSSILLVYYTLKGRIRNKEVVIISAIVGFIGFILALGVGIKCGNVIDKGSITYESYLLTSEDVLIDFPWKVLFKIFPLSLMRATYRWIVLPKVFLLMGAAYLARYLLENGKKILVISFCLLALLEFCPNDFSLTVGKDYANELKELNEAVIEPLTKIGFSYDDRVVFTGAENDYLAPYIAAKVGFKTYNGSGDKSAGIAENYIPSTIQELKSADDPSEAARLVLEVKEKQLSEYVILPLFSLRWNSYSWPVNKSDYQKYKVFADEVISKLDEDCIVTKYEYFYLIQINKSADDEITFNMQNSTEVLVYDGSVSKENRDVVLTYYASTNKSTSEATVRVDFYGNQQELLSGGFEIVITLREGQKLFEHEFVIPEDAFSIRVEYISDDVVNVSDLKGFYVECDKYEINLNDEYKKFIQKGAKVVDATAISGEEGAEFNGNSYVKLKTDNYNMAEDFEIGMQVFLEECPNDTDVVHFARKWKSWQNGMSYVIGIDKGYFVVIFSGNGFASEGIWLDKSILEVGVWNDLVVSFDKGLVTVLVNGEVKAKKQLSFERIYTSENLITIGHRLQGKIKNLYISEVDGKSLNEYFTSFSLSGLEVIRATSYNDDGNGMRFIGDDCLKVKETSAGSVDDFEIGMKVFLEKKPDDTDVIHFARKWKSWQNEMSYVIGIDKGYFIAIFSGTGSDSEGIWINMEILEPGVWNDLNVSFEKGLLTVCVNGEVKGKKQLSFDELYTSERLVEIGTNLSGRIRDLYFSKVDEISLNSKFISFVDEGIEIVQAVGVMDSGEGVRFSENKYIKAKEIETISTEKFEVGMSVFIEEYPSEKAAAHFIRKWSNWQDEMSYVIGLDKGYLVAIFSGTGFDSEGIWLKQSVLELGKWNDLNVSFEKGLIKVVINGELQAEKQLSFDNIYASKLLVEIGKNLNGSIKELYIK